MKGRASLSYRLFPGWAAALCVLLSVAACGRGTSGDRHERSFDAGSLRDARRAPHRDAALRVTRTPPLPKTRAETVAEINRILANHLAPGDLNTVDELTIAWRLGIRKPDTLQLWGRALRGTKRQRLEIPVALVDERVWIQERGVALEVVLGCLGDGMRLLGEGGYRSDSMGRCERDLLRPGRAANALLWLRVRRDRNVANRLLQLVQHALFTLSGDPVPPPPRGRTRLPKTRAVTMKLVNNLMVKSFARSGPATRRWSFAITSANRLVATRYDHIRSPKIPGARPDRPLPASIEFYAPIERLAHNVHMHTRGWLPRPELDLRNIVLGCKGSPVVNGRVQGCIDWNEFYHRDGVVSAKGTNNSLSIEISLHRRDAKDLRALLHHAMFTLKK